MKIFLSHIHEEKPLGVVLKEWIESTFNGNVVVFLSSDKKDNPAGGKWLEKVSSALEECHAMIILCSKESIIRPWINFEAGSGWVKKIPIIPICFNGITKSNLPVPLSEFQSLNLTDADFIDDLFSGLKEHFNIPKIPKIAQNEMREEIDKSLEDIKYKVKPSIMKLPNRKPLLESAH